MDNRDRRQHPRLEGQFQVDLLNMGDDPAISEFECVVTGEALDISRTGLRLKVTYRVPVGTFLSAIVYYRNHESICLCEVVWRRELMGEQVYGLYVREWSKLDCQLSQRFAGMESQGNPQIAYQD
ncbi:MAG: hypothetical protein KCHDKBKB_01872 [Elusimicrobia bacterium]|nr:hypothetical protein [Elusimicrobiota bacterium]